MNLRTSCLILVVALSLTARLPAQSAPAPAPVYASAWNAETHPDFAAFDAWATDFTRATPARRTALAAGEELANGLRLARQRRLALVKLLASDPARALAVAVPAAVREQLPAAVQREVETPFSAIGDYAEYCELRAIGGPAVSPSRREITVGERVYRAHVYGRRAGLTSRRNLFLHGFLLGDDAVLDENILSVLSAAEVARDSRVPKDLSSAAGAPRGGDPAIAEAGGALYRFASAAHLGQADDRLRALEARRTPETSAIPEAAVLENPALDPPTAESAYTTGGKKILIIRVDFSDLTGDPTFFGTAMTPTVIANIANNQVLPFYARSSYGLTSIANTVTTKLYRLPRTASSYATAGDNSALHADAEKLANADYTLANYDRLCVVFSFLGNLSGSRITYGGLAQVGGPDLWINGEFDFRVVAHELGHTYGLLHGNLWQVSDGNPASLNGSSTEYGDDFDTMGANFANSQATDFNVWYKSQLAWTTAAQVQTITATGVYRVNRFDNVDATGLLAIKIPKDSSRNYWVSARRSFTGNDTMSHGAYVSWGYNSFAAHNVLDMQTPGKSVTDAALPTNNTFTDADAHIAITALAQGGVAPDLYEDIRIDLNPPTAGPVITSAKTASGQVGRAFSYRITATNSPSSFTASPLPNGLSVDSATGLISGTPTAAGNRTVTIGAFNSVGSDEAPLALNVSAVNNPPAITSVRSARAYAGLTFTYQITATNSPTDFAATGLPDGLSMNALGLISGAPTTTGDYQATLTATNSSGDGTAVLKLSVIEPPAPSANDNFANALALSGDSGFAPGNNAAATKQPAEPNHADNAGGASLWYAWTAPNNGPVAFDTLGSTFDTLLAVYTGNAVGALTKVASNDDYSANYGALSRVYFPAQAGVTYRLAIDGFDGAAGIVSLNWLQVVDLTPTPTPSPTPLPTPTPIPTLTPTPTPTVTPTPSPTPAPSATPTPPPIPTPTPTPLPPTVSVLVKGSPVATESGAKAKFLVLRDQVDAARALTVHFKLKGSARNGVDYQFVPDSVVIPAGAISAKVKIKPRQDDQQNGTRSVTLKLLPSTDGMYSIGAPAKAKASIEDDD